MGSWQNLINLNNKELFELEELLRNSINDLTAIGIEHTITTEFCLLIEERELSIPATSLLPKARLFEVLGVGRFFGVKLADASLICISL
ncbi:MAG: hypothetical protein ACE5I5_05985 [Candidatus Heimdallarchaeota archaeon]